ncbi:MAG: hypothetical protein Q7U98_20115 [Methylicorpusculum sp.]|uniref:hypothetical protein n=1 Tax=Methylicorpusculum sp. TaxID=2713644 RepID=UPI002726739C|nr:hypothetical protein [Methylicorpusculum sp.]MDO8941470.1 hypothetical protein [Methylicorpusculum sp.]
MVTEEKCRLCQKHNLLQKSHIIPEFFYKTLYDKQKYDVLSTSPEQPNRRFPQGIYEKLLCGDCETHLSKYESYARKLLIGGINIDSMRDGDFLFLSEIDYTAFRLFQLSLIWRAGISTHSFFSNVSLGNHEDKIRELILSNNPGLTWQYGCFMIGLLADDVLLTDLIIQPERLKHQGDTVYRFVFGGFVWIYFVSNRTPPIQALRAFLNPAGNIPILMKNIENLKDFETLAVKLFQTSKL